MALRLHKKVPLLFCKLSHVKISFIPMTKVMQSHDLKFGKQKSE